MTSELIENLVKRVAIKHSVSPHILFDEIAGVLNERFHNYFVADRIDVVACYFESKYFVFKSFGCTVCVEEKLEPVAYVNWLNKLLNKIFRT